ncbi:MAG: hypothetical protein EON52_26235 [Actinomycetales bacterium]|nr:MAG: hypothetical protein EON52_26235 [Actinomycetales bacterium]
MPPVMAAARSVRMSPNRLSVTMTSKRAGSVARKIVAAAITGGIGLAASGNVNPDRTSPSMFEPVHGSAPDIAGQSKADPTAAILSAGLLLEHLGHPAAAAEITTAVEADIAARSGARSTQEVGEAIGSLLAAGVSVG